MRWRRLGHIFVGSGQYPWMTSHAIYPTAENLTGDVFRIYFACYNQNKKSSIGFVDIDLNSPQKLLQLSSSPVLGLGPRGAFDDCGVTPSCFLNVDGHGHLFYMGWSSAVTVFSRNAIGLARRSGALTGFEKVSPAPVIDRSHVDPFTLTYSWVLPRPGGGYRMWYCSNLTWGEHDQEMQHVIKYAVSDDAVHWKRDGLTAVGLQHPGEIAVSRPTVMADADALRMWYCWRNETYTLGFAISEDGINWQRRDHEAGLEPNKDDWEKGSIHYPCVFDHQGQRFMLYNGGRYGSGGFGLALLEP